MDPESDELFGGWDYHTLTDEEKLEVYGKPCGGLVGILEEEEED